MNLGFTNFDTLFQAVKKLGVNSFPETSITGWESKLIEGSIEIETADDIIHGNSDDILFAINPENGNIHKIVLYIPQRNQIILDKWGYPKYHLFHCQTKALKEFFNGKNEKYRISSRTDGKFHFKTTLDNSVISQNNDLELEFCNYCLKIYSSKFNLKNKRFNLKDFFETNYSEFNQNPVFKYDYDDIPNLYANNWKEISTKYKKQKDYTCELCKWKPLELKNQRFIHAHHINGLKYNNKQDNIKILCIYCHSKQDSHSHMEKLPDYIQFLEIYKGVN